MTLDEWAKVASIASPVLSAIVAFVVLRFTMEVQRQNQRLTLEIKRNDKLSDFNQRFADTAELRLRPEVKADPEFYYGRFWSVQKDQFDAWKAGLISNEQFTFWMESRRNDWKENEKIGNCNYRSSYESEMGRWVETDFKRFMDDVHKYGAKDAMNKYKKLGPFKPETYLESPAASGVGLLKRQRRAIAREQIILTSD